MRSDRERERERECPDGGDHTQTEPNSTHPGQPDYNAEEEENHANQLWQAGQ